MVRLARLDAPGMIHHVMVRGVERRRLFLDDRDYEEFLGRIPRALEKAPCRVLAWALMPNHVHLLVRSGDRGLASFMRRLMTGYAMAFNRRHHRVGHLVQNRFKSIVCEEDPYLILLARYIHLNPLKAGLVRDLRALASYPYCGHGAMMGKVRHPWHMTTDVLEYFGKSLTRSRSSYLDFVRDGIPQMPDELDLLGAGLIDGIEESRSSMKEEEERDLHDRRVLGEGEFVQSVWEASEKRESAHRRLERAGIDIRKIAVRVAAELSLDERKLFERNRSRPASRGKALLIGIGREYLGLSLKELAEMTRMSSAAASKAAERGLKDFRETPLAEWLEKLIS
jgi:REP element-mobilizing transposase RayT